MSKIEESKHIIEVREENISKIQEVFKEAEAVVEAEAEAGGKAEAESYEV